MVCGFMKVCFGLVASQTKFPTAEHLCVPDPFVREEIDETDMERYREREREREGGERERGE